MMLPPVLSGSSISSSVTSQAGHDLHMLCVCHDSFVLSTCRKGNRLPSAGMRSPTRFSLGRTTQDVVLTLEMLVLRVNWDLKRGVSFLLQQAQSYFM